MNYIQTLFSYFNAPLFAVFILALFWKRASPWAGVFGQLAGILAAFAFHYLGPNLAYFHAGQNLANPANDQMVNFYGAISAVVVAWIVMVVVTTFTPPKPIERLAGLVWGEPDPEAAEIAAAAAPPTWWESPWLLGGVALGLTLVLSIVFV